MAFQVYRAVADYGYGDYTDYGYFDSEEKAQAALDAAIAEWDDEEDWNGKEAYLQKFRDRLIILNITVN